MRGAGAGTDAIGCVGEAGAGMREAGDGEVVGDASGTGAGVLMREAGGGGEGLEDSGLKGSELLSDDLENWGWADSASGSVTTSEDGAGGATGRANFRAGGEEGLASEDAGDETGRTNFRAGAARSVLATGASGSG